MLKVLPIITQNIANNNEAVAFNNGNVAYDNQHVTCNNENVACNKEAVAYNNGNVAYNNENFQAVVYDNAECRLQQRKMSPMITTMPMLTQDVAYNNAKYCLQ